MDFRKFADGFGAMTCVISVESFGDGKYGKIRIVDGNKPYTFFERIWFLFVENYYRNFYETCKV